MKDSSYQMKPFLIGICGGSNSGKIKLLNEIAHALQKFNTCKISLVNYYKILTDEQKENISEYNFDCPEAFDFNQLLTDIQSLRNNKSITLNHYDAKSNKITSEAQIINPSPVIIFEGIFAFYDQRIRNMMDLKIYIDTDADVRLTQRLFRDIQNNQSLQDILTRYHKFIKPGYEAFIAPTKKYSDIIIPRGLENKAAILLVSEYLKVQLDKLLKDLSLFTSINELIDPKYAFFDRKILVCEEKAHIEFIKVAFEETMNHKQDPDFIDDIRAKLISILPDSLIQYFRDKSYFASNLPKADLIITEKDDINKIDFANYKTIFYYKTIILSEEDIKIPQMIRTKSINCNLIISSIFLSPKFADILLNHSLNNLLFNTLYFSDFFGKFEDLLTKDKAFYDSDVLSKYYSIEIKKLFQ